MKPHLGNGWLFSSSGGGWEYPAFLVVALLVQAALGAGAFAFDPAPSAKSDGAHKALARAS